MGRERETAEHVDWNNKPKARQCLADLYRARGNKMHKSDAEPRPYHNKTLYRLTDAEAYGVRVGKDEVLRQIVHEQVDSDGNLVYWLNAEGKEEAERVIEKYDV